MHPPYRRTVALWAAGAFCAASLSLALGSAACRASAPPIAGVPDRVDFNFHVKPLLSDRCFKCHGPDDAQRKAGLRLDLKDAAFATLESGHRAIVAGSTSKSELVRRITSTDPKVMMPAPESHSTLDEVEKATLIRWIEQGAEWKPHWAFIPPAKPAAAGRADRRLGTHRDRSVRAGDARAEGMAAVARGADARRCCAASRSTSPACRRPSRRSTRSSPTRRRTPTSASSIACWRRPRYGERMAADWLDVARYADSHGYQDDGMREMWPWRDWVIGAFNRNLRVRRVHHLAARRRPAPEGDPGAAHRDRLQPQPHAEPGRRHRRGGIPHRVRGRSRQHARAAPSWGCQRRVRALPRPQVRPGHAEGVLPALQLLQQRQRERTDSRTRACRARQ